MLYNISLNYPIVSFWAHSAQVAKATIYHFCPSEYCMQLHYAICTHIFMILLSFSFSDPYSQYQALMQLWSRPFQDQYFKSLLKWSLSQNQFSLQWDISLFDKIYLFKNQFPNLLLSNLVFDFVTYLTTLPIILQYDYCSFSDEISSIH